MKRRKNKPSIKQNKQVQLTSEQLRQLFFAKCKDRDHLHEWIQLFWGVNLPKSTVSRYSNCNPLDAVWNVYNACIWDMKGLDVLYIAPRAGGKCVLEGTLIPVKDYGLKKIEDVKVGCKIYSGFGWREVLETFDEGVKFGYGIKTVSGKEMVGSINHRVLGYDGVHQTWIHVSDLKVNDIVFGIDDDFNLTEEKVRETFTYTGHFYDLSVKGDHSYVSNGIISHNTLGVAITESMLLFHDRRGAIHIGAIEKQAKRAYSMFQSFLGRNKEILAPLVEKSVIEKTTLIVDNESVTLECLPCTVSACNGPHEAFCCIGGKTGILIDNRCKQIEDSNRDRVIVTAGKLYDMIQSGMKLNALSLNHESNQLEFKPITNAILTKKSERLKISRGDGYKPLWCTPDHMIFDFESGEYKRADQFSIGDILVVPGRHSTSPKIKKET